MKRIVLRSDGARLLCPVRINRRSEGWLLLDTGSTSTILYRSTAERLQIAVTPEQRRVFLSGQGEYIVRSGRVNTLELAEANWSIHAHPVLIVDDTLRTEEESDGVLGMDILSRLDRFTLSSSSMQILSAQHPLNHYSPIAARFDPIHRRIYLPLHLGAGSPIRFLWDTGADTATISPNILPEQLQRRGGRREKVPRVKVDIINTAQGVSRRQSLNHEYWWRFPSARLGSYELTPLPVFEFGKSAKLWGGNYSLLGCSILTEFEVLHDFKHQRLYMRRYRQNLAGTYGLMLTLRETQRGLKWEAFANFPTEVSGRLPDDSAVELLAVNDVPVSQWETVLLIRHLLFPTDRRRCKIRYQAKGKTREAILQAVGVPYIGMPPQFLAIVRIPRTEVAYGLTPEKRVLSLRFSRGLRGVRGSQRNLQVRYVDYVWRFD